MDKEMMAEIGREMERLEDLVAGLRTENERLREALESITTMPARNWHDACRIAEGALK